MRTSVCVHSSTQQIFLQTVLFPWHYTMDVLENKTDNIPSLLYPWHSMKNINGWINTMILDNSKCYVQNKIRASGIKVIVRWFILLFREHLSKERILKQFTFIPCIYTMLLGHISTQFSPADSPNISPVSLITSFF